MHQRTLYGMATILALLFGAWLRFQGLHAMTNMLQYDEAYYAVNAISLIEQPRIQLFFPENTGREGLWMHILAPAINLMGAKPLTLRVMALLVSILTLAAMHRLGREIFGRQSGGLWAMLALIALYLVEHNSHVAFRVLLFPLIGSLALAFLLRAYKPPHPTSPPYTGERSRSPSLPAGQRVDTAVRGAGGGVWLIAGMFMGLLAYTYTAAHGWLAFLLLICLWWAWTDRVRRRGALKAFGVAVILAAPLYLSMAAIPSPDGGLARTLVSSWDELQTNIRNWLFAWRGFSDINPNHNIPNLSIFDDIQAVLALIGLLASPFLVRKKWVIALMVVLFLLSLLPSLITLRTPQYIRAFGMVMPLALCIGAGALALQQLSISAFQRFSTSAKKLNAETQRNRDTAGRGQSSVGAQHAAPDGNPNSTEKQKFNTEKQRDRKTEETPSQPSPAAPGDSGSFRGGQSPAPNGERKIKHSELRTRNSELLFSLFSFTFPLLLLLASALNTSSLWNTWLANYRLNLFVDDRINAGMALIRANTPPDMPVYFPYSGTTPETTMTRNPVAEFHAYDMRRKLVFFPFPDAEGECFVTPREPVIYLDLPNLVNQLERRIVPYGEVAALYHQPDNDYNILQFTPAADLTADWQNAALIGEMIQAQAVAPIPTEARAGEMLTFRLGLRVLRLVNAPYRFFVHVQGIPTPYEGGTLFANGDAPLCQAALQPNRTPDETLVQTFRVSLPDDMPPGNYHIALGLYHPANNERLPLTTPGGETRFYQAMEFRLE